ncbi:MAG: tetratricopeptide repeat protein [Oligoflexales bacterium]
MAVFSSSIVFINRPEVELLVRAELKNLGVGKIEVAKSAEQCIPLIIKDTTALLIMSWDVGTNSACQVLEAIQNPIRVAMHPVFLISSKEVDGMSGLALEYGVSYLHVGDVTADVVKKALKHIEKHEELGKEMKDSLALASDARSKGDLASASQVLKELFEKHPDQERVGLEYCENLFMQENLEDATKILEKYVQTESPNPRALNLYGRTLMKAGKVKEAASALQKADFTNPFNVDRLLQLGDAYLHLQKYDKAKTAFDKAVKIYPDKEDAKKGLCKSMLVGGELNEALSFMKQLSGPREMASVFNGSAILSMVHNHYAEGMKLYGVALDTIGGDPELASKLAFNMGIGFHRQKDNKSAAVCFRIASKMDSGNAKASEYVQSLKSVVEVDEGPLPDDHAELIAILKNMLP